MYPKLGCPGDAAIPDDDEIFDLNAGMQGFHHEPINFVLINRLG